MIPHLEQMSHSFGQFHFSLRSNPTADLHRDPINVGMLYILLSGPDGLSEFQRDLVHELSASPASKCAQFDHTFRYPGLYSVQFTSASWHRS